MQLLIKQRVFSWTDSYDVYDETSAPRYFVKAEFFSLGHQIHIYDKQTGEPHPAVVQKRRQAGTYMGGTLSERTQR